ncbi:MAG: pantetheine-phosphate adenylyltransferase [Armatimonadota bacterium]
MMRALFAGSFDPVTHGHLDLISRMVPLADAVVVAVAINPDKQPIFSVEERVAMLREVCRAWPSVEVETFHGLVVDAAHHFDANVLVRGVRGSSDIDRELQMAQMNRSLTGLETLLLPANPNMAFVSSSLVKEVARFGGDIMPYVPAVVASRLRAYFQP